MNNLRRDIAVGEVVVLSAKTYKGTLEERLFRCTGGFGMRNETMGRAIFGKFLSEGESAQTARVEGYEIDREETEKYQKEQSVGKESAG